MYYFFNYEINNLIMIYFNFYFKSLMIKETSKLF